MHYVVKIGNHSATYLRWGVGVGDILFTNQCMSSGKMRGGGISFTTQCVNNYTVNVKTGLHNESIIILWFCKWNCIILMIKSKFIRHSPLSGMMQSAYRMFSSDQPWMSLSLCIWKHAFWVCQHHYHAVSSWDGVDKVIRLCGRGDGDVCL